MIPLLTTSLVSFLYTQQRRCINVNQDTIDRELCACSVKKTLFALTRSSTSAGCMTPSSSRCRLAAMHASSVCAGKAFSAQIPQTFAKSAQSTTTACRNPSVTFPTWKNVFPMLTRSLAAQWIDPAAFATPVLFYPTTLALPSVCLAKVASDVAAARCWTDCVAPTIESPTQTIRCAYACQAMSKTPTVSASHALRRTTRLLPVTLRARCVLIQHII